MLRRNVASMVGLGCADDGEEALGRPGAELLRQAIESGCSCTFVGDLPRVRAKPDGCTCWCAGGGEDFAEEQPVAQGCGEESGRTRGAFSRIWNCEDLQRIFQEGAVQRLGSCGKVALAESNGFRW